MDYLVIPYLLGCTELRMRIIFGEILNDVADPLEPYGSWLSKAWLPDEILKYVNRSHNIYIRHHPIFGHIPIVLPPYAPPNLTPAVSTHISQSKP
jgi:hypothetical protein